jgi:hypothetical protein
VLAFWTKRTNIARAVMHQAVANHFVFSLKPFAALRAGTACDRTVVRPTLAVDVLVRAVNDKLAGRSGIANNSMSLLEQILRLKSASSAIWDVALIWSGNHDRWWR